MTRWAALLLLFATSQAFADGRVDEISKSELPVLTAAEAACLEIDSDRLQTAQIAPDGSVHGLSDDYAGPMRVVAPAALGFAKAAVAIRHLQGVGGRLYVVAATPSGDQGVIKVSLENELECFPAPAKKVCKRPRQSLPAMGVIGLLGDGDVKVPAAPVKVPVLLTVQIEVLSTKLRVRADSQTVFVPIAKLDALLKKLMDGRNVTIYVNAAAGASWQAVVTTLAISNCRFQEASSTGFDAILLGSPTG